ncbi:uncharacterized protein V6R79_010286 [Siganus canaliculatus]
MELPSRLRDLHVSSSPKKPLPSPSNRPITELLAELQEKLIGCSTDTERSSVIGQAERLFQTADPDWLFPSAGQDGMWAELQAAFSSLLCALIGCAALPLCEDDCGALPAAAYQSIPSRAEAVCSALTALLARGGVHAGVLLAVAPPICVFAVTHVQDQAWTSSSSRAAAQSLQEALLRAGQWRDSAHLLMGEEGVETRGILGGVLDILQPQMTKDSWHRCEATKFVFVWILQQVSRPSLSLHMPRLLPPSLLLSDHHRPENCILGVRCLHHIVVNTPAADLRQFNRADVLYQALFKHLFTSEAGVVQVVLWCLLDLLLVLEKPPSALGPASCRRKPGRHDDVLRLLLTHMEAEHKLALRRIFAAALPPLVDRMGVAVCRHLRRLERVALGYLEVRDPPEETSRLKVLEALETSMRVCWPRMGGRGNVLLRCLLKLLLDMSSDSELNDSVRQTLMNQTSLCLQLLDACCHGNVQRLLRQVDSGCCSSEVLGCLATVTMDTDR